VNPMVGCGMQQARGAVCGVNRQGGEKPRRRNKQGVWQRHAEAERSRSVGVNAQGDVDGGAVFEEPWRRKLGVEAGPDGAKSVSKMENGRSRWVVVPSGNATRTFLRGGVDHHHA
jgi:hypothetical protein